MTVMPLAHRTSRASARTGVRRGPLRSLAAGLTQYTSASAAAGGRVLLLATSLIVLPTAPLLGFASGHPLVFAIGLGILALLVISSTRVPWNRLPRWAALVFPFASLGAIFAFAAADARAALAYSPLIALSFLYLGLFQRAGSSLLLLPLAAAAQLGANPEPGVETVIRLSVSAMIWVTMSEGLGVIVSHQHGRHAALQEQSRTDPLTGLGNRRALDEALDHLEVGDVVVVADLDHFKKINDDLGHAAGDIVLERFAGSLTRSLRHCDHAIRYGGEEFVLVMKDTSVQQAMDVLGRIRKTWEQSSGEVTFSAGVASVRGDRRPEEVLAAADGALYEAKGAGRNRFSASIWDRGSVRLSSIPTQRRAPGVQSGLL